MLPTINEYIEAILTAKSIGKYKNLLPVIDNSETPIFFIGNYGIVFKMIDKITGKFYAVKCFTREQKIRRDSYILISKYLNIKNHPYFVACEYLEDGIGVDSQFSDNGKYPVLIMEWVEGQSLDKYLVELLIKEDKAKLSEIGCHFDQLGIWLLEQPIAHGDLKIDNILVEPDGHLRLIDYDGMYIPEMAGQQARENGSPGFRHPARTQQLFGPFIDDFSILLISLSLHALACEPELGRNKNFIDAILLTESDLQQPGVTTIWENLENICTNKEVLGRLIMLQLGCGNSPEIQLTGLGKLLHSNKEKLIPGKHKDLFTEKLTSFQTSSRWGIIDRKGSFIIPFKYNLVRILTKELLLVSQNHKFGVVNAKEKIIIPIEYDFIRRFSENILSVEKDGKWGFVDISGTIITQCKYDEVNAFFNGYASVMRDDKIGYINLKGEEIIPLIFDKTQFIESYYFFNGLFKASLNGSWGLINEANKVVIPLEYDEIYSFSKLIHVMKNRKWGILDSKGIEILPMKYDTINNFSDELFISDELSIIKFSEKYGLINKSGDEILAVNFDEIKLLSKNVIATRLDRKWRINNLYEPFGDSHKYDGIGFVTDNLISINLNNKWGFVNLYGEEVISISYDEVCICSEGIIAVKKNGKWGFINKTEQVIIPFNFESTHPCNQGKIAVCKNLLWGIIDLQGNEITPFVYKNMKSEVIDASFFCADDCELFNPMLIHIDNNMHSRNKLYKCVELNNKWGCIDSNGHLVVPTIYDDAYLLATGFLIVATFDRWGLHNSKGVEVLEPLYDDISEFSNNMAIVSRGLLEGVIDYTGNEIIPIKYDGIKLFEGFAKVFLNGKCGFIDFEGKELISIKYEDAEYFSEELAAVCLNSRWGYIDKNEKVIIPFKYDYAGYFEKGKAYVERNNGYCHVDKFGNEISSIIGIPDNDYSQAYYRNMYYNNIE